MKTHLADTIRQVGYASVPEVIAEEATNALIAALAEPQGVGVRRRGSIFAIRNLMSVVPSVDTLARSEAIKNLVAPILPNAFPVRAILFDKTPEANWNVVWHQDLSIAVLECTEAPGFGPWSEKAGVVHVQPPAAILERMLTVRLHLDNCSAANGPLRVLPGSHLAGRLTVADIADWRERVPEVLCCVPRGGVLLMRPLLLHASSEAQHPGHRRVIHMEYAAERLPGRLKWYNET